MSTIFRSVLLAAPFAVPASLAFAYTSEQAVAGRAVYEQVCVNCHGANLRA